VTGFDDVHKATRLLTQSQIMPASSVTSFEGLKMQLCQMKHDNHSV